MKTHYELLGLEPTADADAIKKAFRREIARYHPDKVIHLGDEFQEMAATRAAELTVAYKTLTDPALRDGVRREHRGRPAAAARAGAAAARARVRAPDEPPPFQPPTLDDIRTPPPPAAAQGRFASERADRDVILRRAIAGRVQPPSKRCTARSRRRRCAASTSPWCRWPSRVSSATPPPRVLVKVVGLADGAAITEAWNAASRARVHAGKSPVVVLLFSRRIAPANELSKAWDANARQRKAPDAPEEIAVVVVDVADWSCRLPPNCSPAVRKLADQICA